MRAANCCCLRIILYMCSFVEDYKYLRGNGGFMNSSAYLRKVFPSSRAFHLDESSASVLKGPRPPSLSQDGPNPARISSRTMVLSEVISFSTD